MAETLGNRVSHSFGESDAHVHTVQGDHCHEDVTKYCDWLLDSMKSSSQNLRRMVTLILLLVGVFEVIAQSPSVRVSLGAFQVNRNSIVFVFLPALIAYLYLQVILDSVRVDRTNYTYEAAFQVWSSKASAKGLHWWITPTQPAYWNIGARPKEQFKNIHDHIETAISWVLWVIILLGVPGFEIQAFHVLSSHDAHAWGISLIVSCIFLLFALTYMVARVCVNKKT